MSSSYGSRPKPSGGPELTAWLFMRYSGIVLVLLAVGHMFIMHVFNNIQSIDFDFVAKRYVRNFWRGYDLLMLWLAMLHGLNGLRTLIDDYTKPPIKGCAVKGIYLIGAVFLIVGTWVILFFNPATGKVM